MPREVPADLAAELEVGDINKTKNIHQVIVKTECHGPGEQVIHRKSERRKVARDIFLVFEEQSSRRHGRGNNRKRGPLKSKFGHLTVEGPIAKARSRSGLLRDIKNEPKCFLGASDNACAPVSIKSKPKAIVSCANGAKTIVATSKPSFCMQTHQNKAVNSKKKNNGTDAASVNPIFLWAKQEDTRIIEVRCEDYDKRNRIRITKTTTGWRAIPRSDASTSRIVKYLQTPSSLLKLKREAYDNKHLTQKNIECIENILTSTFIPESSSETHDSGLALVDQEQDVIHINPNIPNEVIKNLNGDQNKIKYRSHYTAVDIYTCPVDCDEESIKTAHHVDSRCSVSNPFQDTGQISVELDTYRSCTPELQLCAETGVFLRHKFCKELDKHELSANDSGIHFNIPKCTFGTETVPSNDSIIGSFDTETTNITDLLDDADLIKQCEDNMNNGNEIINSFVKQSCEANFFNQDEMLTKSCLSELEKTSAAIISSKHSINGQIGGDMLPQLIGEISEPSKCLSFNEGRKIKEVNADIFQIPQKFEDNLINTTTAKKKFVSVETTNIDPLKVFNMSLRNTTSIVEGAILKNTMDNTSKDLIYEKSDTGFSKILETNSQCAVTSSSDILISPTQDELPIEESKSKTIKNFILEQFINLHVLNSLPNAAIKKPQQQSGPIVLGKHNKNNDSSLKTDRDTPCVVETVIIDDNSNDEPAKKKTCGNLDSDVHSVVTTITPPTTLINNIDGDPDPLTQLQLLLRNAQWKVPDPILVPKDRLGAILASPAREIPLLITTRPELRLPEAFAYPHIIQNPNILVISMAQLEAILKNEMEKKCHKDDAAFKAFLTKKAKTTLKLAPKVLNTKCSHVEDNNMSSDINAATLAVLKQMLWLPYFGQWSQDIIKTSKEPLGLQHQIPNVLSPYNNIPYGLQHIYERYMSYVKRISNINVQQTENRSSPLPPSPMYLRAIGALQNHVDMMVLQKLLQSQLNNFSNTDQSSSSGSLQKHQEENISSNVATSNNSLSDHQTITIQQQQQCAKKAFTNDCEIKNLSMLNKNKFLNTKPRLTCKSLSNLLESGSQINNHTTENSSNAQFLNLLNIDSCLQPNNSSLSTPVCAHTKISSTETAIDQRECNLINLPRTQSAIDKSNNLKSAEDNTSFSNLFNSDINNGYNSQWNWTTVTATGE